MIKTHSVDVELACKIGFDEANILGHIAYWTKHNKDNNKNFYNGRHWTYNTLDAFLEQFPYYKNTDKINRILKKLEKINAIVKGNFNKNQFDRTAWYSLGDDFLYLIDTNFNVTNECKNDNLKLQNPNCEYEKSILQKREMEKAKMQNGYCENTKSIKNNNQDSSNTNQTTIQTQTKQNPLPPKGVSLPDFIDPNLWQEYLAYKKERREKLSTKGLQMKFSEWAKWDAEGIDVNACIREAMANEWQGVFKPKPTYGAKATSSMQGVSDDNPHGLKQGTLNTMAAFRELAREMRKNGKSDLVGDFQ